MVLGSLWFRLYIETSPGWLELPLTETGFSWSQPVRAMEVILYLCCSASVKHFWSVWHKGNNHNDRISQMKKKYVKVLHLCENFCECDIQATLVISKSKGPAETLRDIRTSIYQMCRIEENTKRTTKFHT